MTRNDAASNPLDDDGDAARRQLNASGTGDDSNNLRTSLESKAEEALTTEKDSEDTTKTTTEDLAKSSSEERQKIADDSEIKAKVGIHVQSEGEPEEEDRLEFGSNGAAGTREPDSKSRADFRGNRLGELTLGAGLKDVLDIGFKVAGSIRVQEGKEGLASALNQGTTLFDESQESSTNRYRAQRAIGKMAKLNNTRLDLPFQPGQDGGLQSMLKSAVRAMQPSLEGRLDFLGQAGDNTTTSAEAEGGLDLGFQMGSTFDESVERRLGDGTEDSGSLEFSGFEDTVDGNVETTLGDNIRAGREEHSKAGDDVGFQGSLGTGIAPVQEGLLQASLKVSCAVKPVLEFHQGVVMDLSSRATERTSLEGSRCLSAETFKLRGRALSTTTENIADENVQVQVSMDAANVDVRTAIDVDRTILDRGAGKPKDMARQTGEQKQARTHRGVPSERT